MAFAVGPALCVPCAIGVQCADTRGDAMTHAFRMLAAVALSGLMGCSVPGTTLRHAPEKPEIFGIAEALRHAHKADVVLVHGMCPHGFDWVTAANQSLATALGMTVGTSEFVTTIGPGGQLYRSELTGASDRVTTYAILWSPAAAPARERLCYDRTDDAPECAGRGK